MLQIFGKLIEPKDFIGIILVILGLICVALTYGAGAASKRSGHYVSGLPCLGAILILIGGLLLPFKAAALLSLTDPGIWGLAYSMIRDYTYNKRFFDHIETNGFSSEKEYDSTRRLIVSFNGKQMELSYITNNPYILNNMRIMFAITFDENGNRYILVDRKENGLERIAFPEDTVQIVCPDKKGKECTLTVQVMQADNDVSFDR